ncbi:MAG: glycosyltransferase family 2 protein [Coriobacteriia bacterium]|nr:glycosyltransferase family 2 protein [Coriobacteriia bacterium]
MRATIGRVWVPALLGVLAGVLTFTAFAGSRFYASLGLPGVVAAGLACGVVVGLVLCHRVSMTLTVTAGAAAAVIGVGVLAALSLAPDTLGVVAGVAAAALAAWGAGRLGARRRDRLVVVLTLALLLGVTLVALVEHSGPVPGYWFVALSMFTPLAAYSMLQRFVDRGVALMGASLALVYHMSVVLSYYQFVEVAAAVLVLLSLWSLARSRWLMSALFVVGAVVLRDTAAVYAIAWVAAWFAYPHRRDEASAPGTVALGTALALGVHVLSGAVGGTGGLAPFAWLGGDSARLLRAASFAATDMPLGIWIAPGAALAALAGALMLRDRWRRVAFVAMVVVPGSALVAFGPGPAVAPWGGTVLTLAFALMPLAFARVLPSTDAALDGERPHADPGTVRIVLPAYNEARSIVDLLERISEVLDGEGRRYTVLVMDDGSTDGTAALALSCAPRIPVHVVTNEVNLGLGGNIARGLRIAAEESAPDDVIVTLDADLTQDPGYIPEMIEVYRGGADVVIASRYRPGARVLGLSYFRHLMSFGARAVCSVVLVVEGVRDYSCGYRLYSARVLEEGFERLGERFVTQRGFACMVEILGKLRHVARCEEIPFILHYDAKRQPSSMSVWKTVWAYFIVAAAVHRDELLGRNPV